jgi:hypothetical protein
VRSGESCRPAACLNESLQGLACLFGSILCSDDPTHLFSASCKARRPQQRPQMLDHPRGGVVPRMREELLARGPPGMLI